MGGPRIRTIKPEWLEDEQLLRAGCHARVLSVALILIADDYGRGRCIPEALAAQVFPFEPESSRVFRESLASLSAMHFVGVYRVREQQYFEIRNWTKHQRVDKPGKPRVPAPKPSDFMEIESSGDTRERFANHSGESRESLAPDLDLDLDQEREPRGRAIPVRGSNGTATAPATPPTAAAAAAISNGEPQQLTSEQVARAWAKTVSQANPGALHAHSQWRSDFVVISIACNAVQGKPLLAMIAVIEWFWLAPDGPVQSGRIKRARANPGQLAKHVSRDLDAAQSWWLKRQATERQHALEVVR